MTAAVRFRYSVFAQTQKLVAASGTGQKLQNLILMYSSRARKSLRLIEVILRISGTCCCVALPLSL